MFAWHTQAPAGLMPACAVADQHGRGAGCDLATDLGQVQGHGVCVGIGLWVGVEIWLIRSLGAGSAQDYWINL